MQKYSKYQETDLLWMGEVPAHWRKDKISRMVEFSASGGTPTSTNESYYDGDIKWVQTGELNDCEIFDTEKKLTVEGFKASSTKLFPAETLLVAMYGATIGKLGILKTEATTNQACCALFFNTKKWNTKYFFYYFLNIREKLIFSSYGGGQPNISQEVIKQERLFVPPFTEQTAIAAYLDQATANIDKVIATKQKQLEKLEQYKQSKIHECVTKGLNPDVTLKPSGIDWIGDVPGHWKVEKIKRRMSFVYGSALKEEDRVEGQFNVYGSNGIVGTHEFAITDGETIIIGRKGTAGALNYSYEPCYPIDTAYFIDKTATEVNIRFLYYALQTLDLDKMNEDSAVPGLSRENAYQKQLAFPPKAEQIALADYLDDFCDKISKEKSIIEQQIEKLKQYRKCLIHECVTGKRKVID